MIKHINASVSFGSKVCMRVLYLEVDGHRRPRNGLPLCLIVFFRPSDLNVALSLQLQFILDPGLLNEDYAMPLLLVILADDSCSSSYYLKLNFW
eukprot:m.190350 g.190350  ORF g.190350 m.190350 type:complete len:94 (-) comp14815_c0_seq2:50-331(-)